MRSCRFSTDALVVIAAISAFAITPLSYGSDRLALLFALVLGLAFALGLASVGLCHLPGLPRILLHASKVLVGVVLQLHEECVSAGQVQGLMACSQHSATFDLAANLANSESEKNEPNQAMATGR